MATLIGFYKRISETQTETGFVVSVNLNADHEVYEGHFPGKPVAPGAALTQMVLDEAIRLTNGEKKVTEFRQIKFLSVIDPTQVQDLELEFDFRERNGVDMFTCVGRSGKTNYFKLNGIFG
jgi:3-hydroxyacyl-[acyl-carrier-protein] dehydratase